MQWRKQKLKIKSESKCKLNWITVGDFVGLRANFFALKTGEATENKNLRESFQKDGITLVLTTIRQVLYSKRKKKETLWWKPHITSLFENVTMKSLGRKSTCLRWFHSMPNANIWTTLKASYGSSKNHVLLPADPVFRLSCRCSIPSKVRSIYIFSTRITFSRRLH